MPKWGYAYRIYTLDYKRILPEHQWYVRWQAERILAKYITYSGVPRNKLLIVKERI